MQLLKSGADPNRVMPDGQPPLVYACGADIGGGSESVSAGASVGSKRSEDGSLPPADLEGPSASSSGTIADPAAIAGSAMGAPVVAALLDAGARVDEIWRGAPPLYYALSAGNVSGAELLVSHGASVDAVCVTEGGSG
jgi:ankyrin repeat protein